MEPMTFWSLGVTRNRGNQPAVRGGTSMWHTKGGLHFKIKGEWMTALLGMAGKNLNDWQTSVNM